MTSSFIGCPKPLECASHGCEEYILEWLLGLRGFYTIAPRFSSARQRTTCVQAQEGLVWSQASSKSLVHLY